ncbi:hypothetical protein SK128_003037 [Halocaridina rubra]|uniref:Ig-like domain-containing protein n=1 Tax=Halocaridina rubra TaxID=373956 RepID=A0AAN8XHC0_HALRR
MATVSSIGCAMICRFHIFFGSRYDACITEQVPSNTGSIILMLNMCSWMALYTRLCIVTGIKVGPVKLIHEQPYLTYQLGTSWNLTVLECPVILEKNEVLGEVEWKFSDGNVERGNFFWKKGAGGTATGLLKDAVKLNRVDGNLEFTTLRYDLAGYYSCVATLENDIYGGNPDWELLIVDTTANSRYESLSPTGERCKFISTFRISPTFPEPTVHSGLYSKKHGSFADEVEPIEWIKQVYSNKSVAYSSEEVEFEITSSIPVDVVFMNTVGVTKADGTYIALTATEVSDPRFNARGCPEYKLKAYQQIEYNSPDKTCRDEIRIPADWGFKGHSDLSRRLRFSGKPRIPGTSLQHEHVGVEYGTGTLVYVRGRSIWRFRSHRHKQFPSSDSLHDSVSSPSAVIL